MYITVMDFSTETITKLVLDVEEKPQTEEVECLLERCGYHLSQVAYMTTDEEPAVSLTYVSDILEAD